MEKEIVLKRLSECWEKDGHYWYPLAEYSKDDVLALSQNYLDEQIGLIVKILIEHNVELLYELWEDSNLLNRTLEPNDQLWFTNDYTTYNEGYWFDENFDWIIYRSHEGMITFGGQWLIDKVMELMPDWKDNLMWDYKREQYND